MLNHRVPSRQGHQQDQGAEQPFPATVHAGKFRPDDQGDKITEGVKKFDPVGVGNGGFKKVMNQDVSQDQQPEQTTGCAVPFPVIRADEGANEVLGCGRDTE